MPKLRTAIGWGKGGFSLVELMAAVGIMGILLAISIPPIYRSMESQASRQDSDALAGRLRLARSQALSNYADVIVSFEQDGANTYTVHIDNGGGAGIPTDPAFEITNKNNGQVDEGEPVFAPIALEPRNIFGYIDGVETSNGENVESNFGFEGDPPQVIFHADGTVSQDGWVAVMPLEDFLEQKAGHDYLVEVRSSTGEVIVENPQS